MWTDASRQAAAEARKRATGADKQLGDRLAKMGFFAKSAKENADRQVKIGDKLSNGMPVHAAASAAYDAIAAHTLAQKNSKAGSSPLHDSIGQVEGADKAMFGNVGSRILKKS